MYFVLIIIPDKVADCIEYYHELIYDTDHFYVIGMNGEKQIYIKNWLTSIMETRNDQPNN